MIKLKDGYTLMHEHLTIDLMPGDLGGTDFDTLCRELTEYSLDEIGAEFGGRDHSTVISSINNSINILDLLRNLLKI